MTSIVLWQYIPTGQGNNLKDFTLRFSQTTTFTGPTDFAGTVSITANPQAISIIGTGRYVEMTLVNNYAGEPGFDGGDRLGIGKVRFAVAAVVPESGTFALFVPVLLGLGASILTG